MHSTAYNFKCNLKILLILNINKKSSELFTLAPYLDESLLLRVYGRVDAASWLRMEIRLPIILPSSHPVTELFVAHIHEKMKPPEFRSHDM